MFKNLLITMALCVALVGCSATSDDIVATSYKSLQTSASLGYAVLASANDLHDQGYLSDEAFAKVYAAAQTFYDTYFAAVDVLYTYSENKDETGKEKLLSYVDLLKSSVNVLLTVVEGLGVDVSSFGVSSSTISSTTTEEAPADEPVTDGQTVEEDPVANAA